MAMTVCRHFSGYKPCGLNDVCDSHCPSFAVARPRILIIHLEALGAVLRTTSLLPAIKRRYPKSHLTWVTQSPAHQLLKENSLIDRILTASHDDLLALRALRFDLALIVDKSIKAAGVLASTQAAEVRGFAADPGTGAILPANPEAEELWRLGLSNREKFFVNQKAETQLTVEAMGLGPWRRDEYTLELAADERQTAKFRREKWAPGGELIVGLNTGCSEAIPYKRWPVEYQRRLVAALLKERRVRLVLLGGPQDEVRNQQIGFGYDVVQSPTTRGLRDGLTSVAACDLVITGDSLGMHMAIALKKWVVAWFGPTCAQEIDLYDRGVKLISAAPCGPCWKRTCSKPLMCYDQVPIEAVISAVRQGQAWITSSFKQPISEISSSPFP